MAVPTKNRKKGGFWKGLLWLVVAVLVLNACVDGAILGELAENLGLDRFQSSGSYVPDDDVLQDDGGDSDADVPGGNQSSGENKPSSGENKPSSGENKPSSGENKPSSGGSQKPASNATYGSGSKPNLPSSLKNNVYLNSKDQGISATFTGKVLITTVFVSDKNTNWTKAEMDKIKAGHKTMTDAIYKEAKAWGVNLELILEYRTASVTQNLATADHNDWYKSALKSAGLTETASTDLENERKVKEAPIFFYLDLTGRAFASSMQGKSSRPEYAVFYNADPGAVNYRHELYHLFGAKDFYYPEAVEALGKKYFSNSVMLSAALDAETDPLTAYLIGWTDKLSADAKTFLEETNWITKEYLKDEHAKETYTGYVENWKIGTATYTGYLVDGVQQGQGTMIWADGRKYTGGWDYGRLHGKGKMIYASGAWYEGSFKQGKLHGTGTYVWASGNRYEGQWQNDHRQGQGKLTYAAGGWYEGQWSDDKPNGQGTMVWENGNKYVGQWKDGQRTGQGKFTYKSGARYEGAFVNGKFHGTGTYYWADGTKYTGQWKESQRTGTGTMWHTNGDRYEGQWKDGKRHGQGTYFYASGGQKAGQWSEGKFVG